MTVYIGAVFVLDAELSNGEEFFLDFYLNLYYNLIERSEKMKIFKRFEEEDLRQLVAEKLHVDINKVTSTFTEELTGYGEGERYEPVFYIEVEEDGRGSDC